MHIYQRNHSQGKLTGHPFDANEVCANLNYQEAR